MSETLFGMEEMGLRSGASIDALSGTDLRAAVLEDCTTVGEAIGKPPHVVQIRINKVVQVPKGQTGDDHDRREALRHLQLWRGNTDKAHWFMPKRPYGQQAEGPGRMPRPKKTKTAAADTSCGLCADPIPAGGFIGRVRPPEPPYQAMGWLCEHCCYTRRAQPRHRDIVPRLFHAQFAGSPVNLNTPECACLLDWLRDPGADQTPAWKQTPLDSTLLRLEAVVAEGKEENWLALPTVATVLDVLGALPFTADATTTALLSAADTHRQEWSSPPDPDQLRRRYGTGPGARAVLLKATVSPSLLSERGGPFDLDQAQATAEEEESESETESAVSSEG